MGQSAGSVGVQVLLPHCYPFNRIMPLFLTSLPISPGVANFFVSLNIKQPLLFLIVILVCFLLGHKAPLSMILALAGWRMSLGWIFLDISSRYKIRFIYLSVYLGSMKLFLFWEVLFLTSIPPFSSSSHRTVKTKC